MIFLKTWNAPTEAAKSGPFQKPGFDIGYLPVKTGFFFSRKAFAAFI